MSELTTDDQQNKGNAPHFLKHVGECTRQAINIDFALAILFLVKDFGPSILILGPASHFSKCMLEKNSHDLIDDSALPEDVAPITKLAISAGASALKYGVKFAGAGLVGSKMSLPGSKCPDGIKYLPMVVQGATNGASYYLTKDLGLPTSTIFSEVFAGVIGGMANGKEPFVALKNPESFVTNVGFGVAVTMSVEFHKIVSPAEDYAFSSAKSSVGFGGNNNSTSNSTKIVRDVDQEPVVPKASATSVGVSSLEGATPSYTPNSTPVNVGLDGGGAELPEECMVLDESGQPVLGVCPDGQGDAGS